MGKVVETVVAQLLTEEAEKGGQQTNGQDGSSKGRLAIDPAASIVNRAHGAWIEGQIAGILLMYINAAFPRVRRGKLFHTITRKGMNRHLISWTASFLTDRKVKTVIKGNVMQRRLVNAGIAQSSLVCLMLFAIYPSKLIQ